MEAAGLQAFPPKVEAQPDPTNVKTVLQAWDCTRMGGHVMLMGFTLQPLHARLALWSRRPTLSSVVLVVAAGLVIVSAVVAFASAFVSQAVTFSTAVREQLQPGGALAAWAGTVTGRLSRLGLSPEAIVERVRAAAGDIATGSASVAGTVASVTLPPLRNKLPGTWMLPSVPLKVSVPWSTYVAPQ